MPGKSHAPQVKVFDLLKTIAAAPPAPPVQVPNAGVQVPGGTFNYAPQPGTRLDGGFQVAVGDVTGDGTNDIVVTPGRGVSTVEIFKNPGAAGTIPAGITPFASFNAFPTSFIGGATVATGDVLSKGYSQIVVGSGSGMPATVEVFDAKNFAGIVANPLISKQFNPFGVGFRGGVSVATGDIDNLNGADIIIGAGQGGGGRVAVWNVKAAACAARSIRRVYGQRIQRRCDGGGQGHYRRRTRENLLRAGSGWSQPLDQILGYTSNTAAQPGRGGLHPGTRPRFGGFFLG